MSDSQMASERVGQLLVLTRRLTERLAAEAEAFETHRAHEVAQGVVETQELANVYRREAARVKADRGLIAAAPAAERKVLADATRAFEQVLERHAKALQAAKEISEGLIQAIAREIASARAKGVGYGAGGRAPQGDARAVALNRTA